MPAHPTLSLHFGPSTSAAWRPTIYHLSTLISSPCFWPHYSFPNSSTSSAAKSAVNPRPPAAASVQRSASLLFFCTLLRVRHFIRAPSAPSILEHIATNRRGAPPHFQTPH